MKNLEEYIEKAKTLENSRPLLTVNDLSAMLDARESAPIAGGGASQIKNWRKFILPTFSVIMVLIAVLSSINRTKAPIPEPPENPVKIEKNTNSPNGNSNGGVIATENNDNSSGTRKNSATTPSRNTKAANVGSGSITQERQKVEDKTEKYSQNETKRTDNNIASNGGSTPTEAQRQDSKFDMDGFRAEQMNMLDSMFASRFAKIDSLLAMQPRETHRVDTVVIREIITKDPLDINFRNTFTVNFWLLKDNIYEIQWEFAPLEHWSFTIKGGYGSLLGKDKVFRTNTGIEEKSPYKLLIFGSKVTHYLFGDFDHGAQVGLDATYYSTSYNVARASGPYGEGRGLNVTPFAGYKVILAPGYTLNVQAGYGMKYHNIFEGYRDGSGVYQGYIKSQFKPTYVFNVNFGWSL